MGFEAKGEMEYKIINSFPEDVVICISFNLLKHWNEASTSPFLYKKIEYCDKTINYYAFALKTLASARPIMYSVTYKLLL